MTTLDDLLDLLIRDGAIALIALAVIAAELTFFALIGRRTIRFAGFVPNALAGMWILVALYVAMTDAPDVLIALALICALASHVADLVMRQRAVSRRTIT